MVNVLNYVVLTVSSDNGSQIVFNETVPATDYPFMLVADNPFEIMQADSQVNSTTIAVTRGQEGTSQGTLTGSTTVVCELTHITLEDIYDEILLAEKVLGNAYTTAERTAITPSIGETALDTDQSIVYIGVSGSPNTWEVFNPASHADYSNLSASVAHLQYYTTGRADTWHSNLSDEHLTTVDHDHFDYPASNIRNLATQPADTLVGGIWLENGTKTLYFYDGTTWKQYDTVPQYMMIFRDDGTCPEGWTEKTGWDGKYLKGQSAGVWTGGSGGSLEHQHTLTDVPQHAHSVPTRSITTTTDGSHSHSRNAGGGSGGAFRKFSYNSGGRSTGLSASHTHTATVPEHTTLAAGNSTATTELATSEPVNVELTLCEKS